MRQIFDIIDPQFYPKIAMAFGYHENARGDTVAISDQAGSVVMRLAYSAYGEAYKINAATGALEPLSDGDSVKYGFQGREIDEETGLLYFRNRYYSPTQGRFLQRDMLGYVDGLGLHEAFGGNPGNVADPMGKDRYVIYQGLHTAVAVDTWEKEDGDSEWKKIGIAQYHFSIKWNSVAGWLGQPIMLPGSGVINKFSGLPTFGKVVKIYSTPEQDTQLFELLEKQRKTPYPYSIFWFNCRHWAHYMIHVGFIQQKK